MAIAGGGQSGKSTLLRTIITGLALTHTPQEVQVYCLDFGGGSLGALRDLPHVGGVAGRQDALMVRRTVSEVSQLLNTREARFAEHGRGDDGTGNWPHGLSEAWAMLDDRQRRDARQHRARRMAQLSFEPGLERRVVQARHARGHDLATPDAGC